MPFMISPAGANPNLTDDAAQHRLGTLGEGDAGMVYMYCQASTTLSQYDTAVIDSNYKANPITSALVTEGAGLGWPQVAVDAGDYFWAALKGRAINIRVASACSANVPLYTTATAGVLDDAVANNLIEGVRIVTTQTSTTGLAGATAYAIFPRVGASV